MNADPLRNTVHAARRALCPECGAKPGDPCKGATRLRRGCHRGRWNAYRDLDTIKKGTMQ